MLRPLPRFALVGVLTLTTGWLACVGDDPGEQPLGDGSHAVGDRLGPCFPDGKCKEGLVCRDGEICLTADEPKPTTEDGGSPTDGGGGEDGSTEPDSGGDGGAGCTVTPTVSKPGPECLQTPCSLGSVCCFQGTTPSCVSPNDPNQCPQTSPRWGCDTNSDCAGNLNTCCFAGTDEGTGSKCGRTLKSATSSCVQPNTCQTTGVGKTTACVNDGECPTGQKCIPIEMRTALNFTTIVMACRY